MVARSDTPSLHTRSPAERLRVSLPEHYRQLYEARKSRTELIGHYAGTSYPNLDNTGADLSNEVKFHDLVNYLRDFADSQTLAIAANRPRFLVNSLDPSLLGLSAHLQRTLDTYSRQIRLEKTLQRCALDGFFGLAIAKVCLHEQSNGFNGPLEYATFGAPNVIRVSYDHFCYDVDATDYDFCSFMADRYRRPFEEVIADEDYDEDVRKELAQIGPTRYTNGEDNWAERLTRMDVNVEIHEDWCYLADVWSARERKIYRYVVDHDFSVIIDKPLKVTDGEGKATGPYSLLNQGRVPDNTNCASPGHKILKQHEMANVIWRKQRDQVERQKNVGIVPGSDDADLPKYRDAVDGQWLSSPNPQAAKVEKFDGPDAQSFALLMQLEQRISKSGGNTDLKLGTSQQADTASQEGMLQQNASRSDADYSQKFVAFVREIAMELARLVYQDKALHIPQTLTIPNTGNRLPPVNDDWKPTSEGSRPMPFDALDIDIDPESLPLQSSAERAGRMRADLQMFLPAMEILNQQGIQLDLAATLDKLAELENRPELRTMFKYDQPIPPSGGSGDAHSRSMPQNTQREYVHRSESSGPSDDNQSQMLMAMAGANGSAG